MNVSGASVLQSWGHVEDRVMRCIADTAAHTTARATPHDAAFCVATLHCTALYCTDPPLCVCLPAMGHDDGNLGL